MVDLPDNLIDFPDTIVDLPDAMVNFPDTPVDLSTPFFSPHQLFIELENHTLKSQITNTIK